jgi:hypothetical protein
MGELQSYGLVRGRSMFSDRSLQHPSFPAHGIGVPRQLLSGVGYVDRCRSRDGGKGGPGIRIGMWAYRLGKREVMCDAAQ